MKIFDENDIDRVVHFAAESHVDRSIRNPEVFVKTNVLGTLVMLNAAKSAWELPENKMAYFPFQVWKSKTVLLTVFPCHMLFYMPQKDTPAVFPPYLLFRLTFL